MGTKDSGKIKYIAAVTKGGRIFQTTPGQNKIEHLLVHSMSSQNTSAYMQFLPMNRHIYKISTLSSSSKSPFKGIHD